jgi:lauroyl/myristoyl acyltransferase
VTAKEHRLEAPHKRLRPETRWFERAVVAGYKAFEYVISHVPPAIPKFLLARGAQLSYLLWPMKRAWSNANFGHVLGLPPGHPRVRRTALKAYGHYGRYVVELARLPRLAREHADELVRGADLDAIHKIWEESKGGLIFSMGHVGNGEAVAAGVASRGWPINVVADDSSYPGLFEEFSNTREQWGVHVIPWRNLREIYTVLRRREMLALLIDWGYRPDGIPVKLFDAWTTLPAGPATLAAKTGSRILPVTIRRNADGKTFGITWAPPIEVTSSDPASLQAATQLMADAFAASIAPAPEQWYSFKPVWPMNPAEGERLAKRAVEMATRGRLASTSAASPSHGGVVRTGAAGDTEDAAAAPTARITEQPPADPADPVATESSSS